MAELGKPKEFSVHGVQPNRAGLRVGKGAVTAALAALFLLAVLLIVSGCVPTT